MSDLLTEAEIYELTAPVTQPAAQTRRLSELLGCQIRRRPDGRPIVTRKMLERLQRADEEQNEAGITWSQA